MPDPPSTSESDAAAEHLAEFRAVIDADDRLDAKLAELGTGEYSTELAEEARDLLRRTQEVGTITWQFRDRDKLDAVAHRAARVLWRHGEDVGPVRIKPFEGRRPTFRLMGADEFLSCARDDGQVIGRRLMEVDLRSAEDIDRASVKDCAFVECDLRGVNLSNARILHCVFDRCLLDGADLRNATVSSSLIRGRPGKRRCGGEGFTDVCADDANFSGSRLDKLTLTDSSFKAALFSYAYVSDLEGDDTTCLDAAAFDLARIEGLSLQGTSLRGALFVGADLLRVNFRGADLEGAVFSSAKLGGAIFLDANLKKASFTAAYFASRAEFNKTALEAIFEKADEEEIRARLATPGTADVGEKPADPDDSPVLDES